MDFKFVLRLLEANQFENEVVEYKKNNKDFIVLGKNISALSNTAALLGIDKAYIILALKMVRLILSVQILNQNKKKREMKSLKVGCIKF